VKELGQADAPLVVEAVVEPGRPSFGLPKSPNSCLGRQSEPASDKAGRWWAIAEVYLEDAACRPRRSLVST
jgi:hypothetical protein